MTFSTNKSINECKAKLSAAADTGWKNFKYGDFLSHREMVGIIDDTTLQLRVNNGWFRQFQPIFYGKFIALKDATLIQGDFTSPDKVFMILPFAVGCFFTLVVLVFALIGGSSMKEIGEIFLFMVGIAVYGVVFIKLGKRSMRNKQRTIVEFLKNTLEANEVA